MSVVDTPNTMAVETLSPMQDANLFQPSTAREDDQTSEESFNLHLSEDEEESAEAKRNEAVNGNNSEEATDENEGNAMPATDATNETAEKDETIDAPNETVEKDEAMQEDEAAEKNETIEDDVAENNETIEDEAAGKNDTTAEDGAADQAIEEDETADATIEEDATVTADKTTEISDTDKLSDKFEDNDNATEAEHIDNIVEDKLLNTNDDDCAEKKEEQVEDDSHKVAVDEEEDEKIVKDDDGDSQTEKNKDDALESETKSDSETSLVLNKDNEEFSESAEASSVDNKDDNLISSGETVEEQKADSEGDAERKTATEDELKEEAKDAVSESQEKENEDVLKNQIMDTEDLLQIVDKDQTEEDYKEDSSGRNSPRSPEDDENDKMDVECDDVETEKMECDDDDFDVDENRTIEKPSLPKDLKDIDAVDIDEESNPLKDCDVDIDKEYDNLAASADLDEPIDNDKTVKNIEEEKDESSHDKIEEAKDVSEKMDAEKDAIKDIEMNDDAEIEKKQDEKEENQEQKDVAKAADTPDGNEDTNMPKPAKRSLDDTDANCSAKKLKLNETDSEETSTAVVDDVVDLENEKPKENDANDAAPVREATPPPAPIKIQFLNAIDEYIKLKNLKKFTYNDLEQIILQKICEAICHKSEIGELRHQLGVQEQMVEMWRKEVGQLTKQARDLEIVNKRLLHEVRLRGERDKPLMPVKITRSVGLQVRSDNNSLANATAVPTNTNTTTSTTTTTNNNNTNTRNIQRTVNRRQTTPTILSPAKQTNTTIINNNKTNIVRNNLNTNNNRMNSTINNKINSNNISNKVNTINNKNTPVVANKVGTVGKVMPINVNNSGTTIVGKPGPLTPKPIVSKLGTPGLQNSTPSTVGNATANTISSTPTGTGTTNNATLKSNTPNQKTPVKSTEAKSAVIDLTDEDDKKPANTTNQAVRIVSTPVKAANVTTGNVVNPPRIMYVYNNQLHQGVLSADPSKSGSPKLMLKLNSNVIGNSKTIQSSNKITTTRSLIGSANGVLTAVSNGSTIAVTTNSSTRTNQVQPVRIATTPVNTNTVRSNPTIANKTVLKHPAPLPQPPANQMSLPSRKPVPPKPHLSIKRSSNGLILSWKMPYNLDNYESIVSYQLYAYQETSSPPSSEMWRKVGDVKALALPMACTLTQFADGNKYHFAVRAVDVLKRMGAFSDPEQILL